LGDEQPTDEDGTLQVLVPAIVGKNPHRRSGVQRWRLHLDPAVVEGVQRELSAFVLLDSVGSRDEDTALAVSARCARADGERFTQAVHFCDVVCRGAERRGAGLERTGDVPAGVEEPHTALGERRHTADEIGERESSLVRIGHITSEEPFLVCVAARCGAGHGEKDLAVRVAVEVDMLGGEPALHFGRSRVAHDHEGLNIGSRH